MWQHPAELVTAGDSLRGSGLFSGLSGPLDPNGTALPPSAYTALHAALGDPRKLPLAEPATAKAAAISASDYNAYRASAEYVSADGRTIRFAAGLRAGAQQPTAAMNDTPAVRAALATAAAKSGAAANGVAGQAAGLYDVSSTASNDMVRIIPIAVVAIAILLGLVLRSLVAPLYLVVTIAASYLAALGLTTFLVITLGGADGLVFILPFLMFVFLLALGEDYNILIMTRIREEAATLPLREAVIRAIGSHRAHGDVGGADPGGHLRGLRGGRRRRDGRPAPGDRPRPGPRRAARHVRRPHAAHAVDRRAPRPVELVAVPADQRLARRPRPRRAGPSG